MEKLNLDKKSLRKFGVTMAIAFLIITLIIFIRHKYSIIPTFIILAIFLILAFTLPALLKPVYILWMRLAFVLSWINTRLILFILFYLLFAPVGLMMRLFRVDLLDRKIEKDKKSYWRRKEKKEFSSLDYERQF
jgi:hypothetical protein